MIKSEKDFASFALSKTRKFDNKKDQESLRQSFYKLAAQYFEVSCFTIKNSNWIPVTLANVAFSCELFLKAIFILKFVYESLVRENGKGEELR